MTDLLSVLRRWRRASPVVSTQAPAFEQVTRERVDGLRLQVDRIEAKINGLLLALTGAVLAEIYRAVAR